MDIENGIGGGGFDFSEKSVRRAFVRKVYAILTIQLLITLGIICLFVFVESIKQGLQDNPGLIWIPVVLSFVIIIVLACGGDIRRKTPYNYIGLLLFTLCEGCLIGAICSFYDADEVVIAIVTTMVVVIGLTLFAFQTKIDFTLLSGMMFALSMSLLMFGIFALIFQSNVLNVMYACLGALVFSLYLVFDTQLILGGKHKVQISPEEYIFAALNLYMDIINLFIFILALVGGGSD